MNRRQFLESSTAAALLGAVLTATPVARAQRDTPPKGPARATALALEIADYASLPATGSPDGTGNNAGSLARINVMRQEPGPGGRLFINDLTGPLYILDPRTKSATTYLDFNGRGPRTGLFDKLTTDAGLASGFISFEFDPDYGRNGRFYTIHLEEIALPGRLTPDNQSFPDSMSPATRPPRRSNAGIDRPRRRAHRMDGLEHREHNIRGPRPRAAAHSAQQPDPSARRRVVQSGRSARHCRLASAVRRVRRWRVR